MIPDCWGKSGGPVRSLYLGIGIGIATLIFNDDLLPSDVKILWHPSPVGMPVPGNRHLLSRHDVVICLPPSVQERFGMERPGLYLEGRELQLPVIGLSNK